MPDDKKEAPEREASNQIIKLENDLVKFDPEADIIRGQKAAKALMKLIKLTKPLKLGGKDYLYFEHWVTIARFFNATVGIEWTKKTETGWEAKAIVYQNGQIIGSAEAACNNDEANWKTKPDFQRKSMAQTRAAGKALRQIFGYIPVLVGISATPAEEMTPEAPQTQNYGPTMANGRNVANTTKPISQAQAWKIKSLRTQKGLSQITDEELRKLTSLEASDEITRLMAQEEIPTITIEPGDLPQ